MLAELFFIIALGCFVLFAWNAVQGGAHRRCLDPNDGHRWQRTAAVVWFILTCVFAFAAGLTPGGP